MMEDNVRVTLDGEHVYPAYDDGQRWNGFVMPRFRGPVVFEVANEMNREAMADWCPSERTFLAWADLDLLVLDMNAVTVERVRMDDDQRWALGAGSWQWQTLGDE